MDPKATSPAKTNPGGNPGSAAPGPVAGESAPKPGGAVPPAPPGKPPVAKAAGGEEPGKRKFKFAADTPEGKEERRKADADRKKRDREEAARLAEPPPLPPAGAGLAGDQTPSGSPLAANQPGEDRAPAVPWTPELVSSLLDQLVEAAEEGRVASYVARCQEAGLMPKLIKEIEQDAHFPPAAKTLLKESLPRLAAKWLNKSGISAEYRDEIAVVSAFILLFQHNKKTEQRFAEILAEVKKANEEKEQKTAAPAS